MVMSDGYYGGFSSRDRVGGGFSQKDAQRSTKATGKQTKEAWHDARNDAAKEGGHGVPKSRHKKR